jgi:hypothetical protein
LLMDWGPSFYNLGLLRGNFSNYNSMKVLKKKKCSQDNSIKKYMHLNTSSIMISY